MRSLKLIRVDKCSGSCLRELYEGDCCEGTTCEYHIDDPHNAELKAELLKMEGVKNDDDIKALLREPVVATKPIMRNAMYPTHPPTKRWVPKAPKKPKTRKR